jgi:hypothetical protein
MQDIKSTSAAVIEIMEAERTYNKAEDKQVE